MKTTIHVLLLVPCIWPPSVVLLMRCCCCSCCCLLLKVLLVNIRVLNWGLRTCTTLLPLLYACITGNKQIYSDICWITWEEIEGIQNRCEIAKRLALIFTGLWRGKLTLNPFTKCAGCPIQTEATIFYTRQKCMELRTSRKYRCSSVTTLGIASC